MMENKYVWLVDQLNDNSVDVRLDALKKLKEAVEQGKLPQPETGTGVNNHIHTWYSFSPYSPSKAIWMAYNAGLETAGLMDHDSISGAEEFIEAGKIAGLAATIGVECRADFSGTPLNGKRINNPDQKSIAYIALHGIPHTKIDTIRDFFKPFSEQRNLRNIRMTEKLNEVLHEKGLKLDYERDIVPLSKRHAGGSITERHIIFALGLKIVTQFGKGKPVVDFLQNDLRLSVSSKVTGYLSDPGNEYYVYDLLGALKSDLVERFYIDACEECPSISTLTDLCTETGAIPAYAYLGDVGDSVTGDKKIQKFEDEYLDLLFEVITQSGIHAVTYMPSRNTMGQLKRVQDLCSRYDLIQISGEDINSPRQSFICAALQNPQFRILWDSTWALIGHEKAATDSLDKGMFSLKTKERYPFLAQRIQFYKEIGKQY